ncbi:MAG: HigA family addiction module antitoxin [Acidobacteriaceae bacterium]
MSIPRKASDRGFPIHPGEFLREDFMKPLGLSAASLASALKVPVGQISGLVKERRRMSAEMAMRLERCFGTSADFWMKAQMQYDLESVTDNNLAAIRREVRPAPRDRKIGELKRVSGGVAL